MMKSLKTCRLVVGTVLSIFMPDIVCPCTNFLVGKDASIDGSTMITYAADSYTFYGYLHFQEARDYPDQATRDVIDWDSGKKLCVIPQVRHTYRVIGNMNEHQLTIGETTWGGRKELTDTASTGIDYGSLIYIALERCKTAREAIHCITNLANTYGYASEGETFSIADPNEIWIMDLIGKGSFQKGVLWVATRIPDDCICAHANQARTTKINYTDTANCLFAPDIILFAKKHGYFSGRIEDFSFRDAFAPIDFSALYVCEARVWSFFNHFADMDEYYDYAFGNTFRQTNGKDYGNSMPLYIKPNRKVSIQDLRTCMRDQYENTPNDITQTGGSGPWHSKLRYGKLGFEKDSVQYWYPRPTATQQTAWSFIAQMNTRFSPKTGGLFWFAVDDAATSVYIPFFSNTQFIPDNLKKGNGDLLSFSSTSAWWIFNIVANWAYTKYSRMKPDIDKIQQKWEQLLDEQIPIIRQQADASSNDSIARYITSSFSATQTRSLLSEWKDLGIFLFVKYLDGQEKKEQNGIFLRDENEQPLYPHRLSLPDEDLEQIINNTTHE